MMIRYDETNLLPKVEAFEGGIAVYGGADGDIHGFTFSGAQAYETAVAMLGAVADLHIEHRFTFRPSHIGFAVDTAQLDEPEGILTFEIGGAPIRASLTPTEIAELAASFTRAARFVDAPRRPRRDR